MFGSCLKLKSVNLVIDSILNRNYNSSMSYMFSGCSSLEDINVLNFTFLPQDSIAGISNIFRNCTKLTDTSLDNILQSCINISYIDSRYKQLSRLGITDSNLLARIPSLPHYQDFLNAGWTIS